jgi:hypothetical protein
MILKSLSRKSNVGQLIQYLFKHDAGDKPKPLLKHNLRARSIKGWTKEFEDNNALRLRKRVDSPKLNHVVISFHHGDQKNITDKILKDLAKQYIELRGKDSLYLVNVHRDKQHVHFHIAQSTVRYKTGETNRLSKKEFQELKINLQEYQRQKYAQLKHSLPEHGKKHRSAILKVQALEKGQSHKQQVYEAVDKIYSNSKSLDAFYQKLSKNGYEPYIRGGKLYGVEHQDRNFRFNTMGITNEKLEALNKQPSKEEKALKELKELRSSKEADRNQEIKQASDGKALNELRNQYKEHDSSKER